jgi:hypothetical protein
VINDLQVRAEVTQQWAVVRRFCAGSHRQYLVGGVFVNETPPEEFYNLPLILAFAVLDQVLTELIGQGTIPQPKRPLLGARMHASSTVLRWINYALVDSGKTARNNLAHEARLIGKLECLAFIEAIEVELKSWSILMQ